MTRIAIIALSAALLHACASHPSYKSADASLARFGLDPAESDMAEPGAMAGKASPGVGGRAIDDEPVSRIDEGHPEAPPVTEQDIRDQFRDRAAGAPTDARVALVEVSYSAGSQVARPVGPDDLVAFEKGCGQAFRTVQTVPEMLMPNRLSWMTMRYCAARTNADLLLLLTRATERYDYNNNWSNLYFTLVGAIVLPGNSIEVHGAIEGALIDVRTGKILGVLSVGHKSLRRLLPLEDEVAESRDLVRENADALFDDLGARTARLVGKSTGN